MNGSLDISIEHDFWKAIEAFQNQLSTDRIMTATRVAMKKTLITLRTKSVEELRRRLNVRESDLTGGGKSNVRTKRMWIMNPRGNTIEQLEGAIAYSQSPLPLIMFVKGGKQPIRQKGVPVSRRRKLKVEIERGKVIVAKRAFIQHVHTVQVFRRKGEDFYAQSSRSIGNYLLPGKAIRRMIETTASARFGELLNHELKARAAGFVKEMDQKSKGSRGGKAL